MNCRRSEELWSDYVDGTLPPLLSKDLDAHVAACEDCRSLFETFREVVATLEAIETPAPPAALAARVVERARQQRREPVRAPERWPSVAAFAAAAAVLLVFLFRPPELLSDWSLEARQSARHAYSYSVRTYQRAERWVEELDMLRMSVSVALEDRLDQLSEQLNDLQEARRRAREREGDQSFDFRPSGGLHS